MSTPIFCDVSNYQKVIDWAAYKKYAASFDGIARVAIKSSEGEGFKDPSFEAHRAGALAAGIDEITYYHFGRPGLGNLAVDEAESQRKIVGAIRDSDVMCLDMEETMPQANAAWALAWLAQQQHNYGKPPVLYSYLSYIQTRLQDPRLANYPLWLAAFSYNATARPACPKPWVSYAALQYSDKATIPGIASAVDANVYLLAPTQPTGGVPVPVTTSGGENATFIDNITQLEGSESQDECVAFSAANVFYSTAPGVGNPHTPEDVDKLADQWYTRFTGSLQSSSGLSVEQLHTMLSALGLSFEVLPIGNSGSANDEAVRSALRAGKIVIVCAAESSFFDLQIGRPPYSWNTKPFNHCIVVSGLITSGPYKGNVWVRDTVAVSGGYPPSTKRPYDLGKMQYVSLTAVTPNWLKGANAMPVPTGWKDTNNVLTAPNGIAVVHGFRDLIIKAANWDAGNVPYEAEYHADQVLLHNATVGAGQRQCFRDDLLWYTTAKGVVQEPFLGQEIDAAYKQIAALQAQIDALKVGSVQAITSVAQEALKGLQAIEAALVAALPKG